MKAKYILLIILSLFLFAACVQQKPVVVSTPPVEPCPMPTGYQLQLAVQTAEQTLTNCPDRLDAVFLKLIEIAKHKPNPENKMPIQNMLKRLVAANKISEKYAKGMYQKYFAVKFVSLPDVKTYELDDEIESIKRDLKAELALKRIGLIECSNDRDGYKKAESEYVRVINLMENLVLNEQYVRENR